MTGESHCTLRAGRAREGGSGPVLAGPGLAGKTIVTEKAAFVIHFVEQKHHSHCSALANSLGLRDLLVLCFFYN